MYTYDVTIHIIAYHCISKRPYFPHALWPGNPMSCCRRDELGPLADDGLAMYLGAWEWLSRKRRSRRRKTKPLQWFSGPCPGNRWSNLKGIEKKKNQRNYIYVHIYIYMYMYIYYLWWLLWSIWDCCRIGIGQSHVTRIHTLWAIKLGHGGCLWYLLGATWMVFRCGF